MNQIKTLGRWMILGFCILLSGSEIQAQTMENLNHLKGHNVETYYSEGTNVQAEFMATLCDNVLSYYKSIIDFEPTVTLLVLSPSDWSKYTHFPVYGMPHYPNEKTLVVASDDNDFWKSMLPPLEHLPAELAHNISKTYSDKNNNLTMRGFFDLLAIHELGHAFHEQGALTMQRKWLGELFANMFLHTYIAEKEPELLPALTLFPTMVISSTKTEDLTYSTLSELEENYGLIASQYPQNYGWYQCQLHTAAGNIYNKGGVEAFQKLWKLLKSHHEPLDDSTLAELLSNRVHESVSNVQLKWNE